jgi:K+/H+ antiporter YhaU regulatory subunit KhtT
VAVRHAGGKLDVLPAPDALFEESDTITVVGTDDKIEKLTKRLQ